MSRMILDTWYMESESGNPDEWLSGRQFNYYAMRLTKAKQVISLIALITLPRIPPIKKMR